MLDTCVHELGAKDDDYPSFSMTAGALMDRPLRKPNPSPPWYTYQHIL